MGKWLSALDPENTIYPEILLDLYAKEVDGTMW